MPQQKSLFSFFSSGPSAGTRKPKESSVVAELLEDGDLQSSPGVAPEIRATMVHNAGNLHQKDVFNKIQQKFMRKAKETDQDCSAHQETSSDLLGQKRGRESEVLAHETSPPDAANEKRARLLEAIGADDCSAKGGAWEAAKAKFEWMTPSKIRDGKKRKPGDPSYDARTLFIPDDVFSNFSASQKQYWSTKRHYMDTLLFFKVGKFYELYELDAEIGHKELDWKLIVSGVGKCRQVGCPESGIDDAVQKLVSRGYKVGRMEQTETAAEARANGGRNATVQRKLTQVVTPSTLMDGNLRPEAVHLLALKEDKTEWESCENSNEACSSTIGIGFAFVDAAAGQFYVGTIRDDSSRSALVTLLTQVAPQELLYETQGISDETRRAFRRSSTPGSLPLLLTPLQSRVEFMEAATAMRLLRSQQFFNGGEDADWSTKRADAFPEALESLAERDLAISALGALVCHLTRIKCDDELLPNGILSAYEVFKGSLRLDGQTVENLELLQNRADGGNRGTLFSFLDSCVTQFGKRLLRRWICHPLQSIEGIEYRLDAVEELASRPHLSSSLRGGLRKMPDLERLVARLWGLAASPMLGLVPSAARKVHQRRVKAFCLAVLGMRTASNLLLHLKKHLEDYGPSKSKFLQAASRLSEVDAVKNSLDDLQSCVDESSKIPQLIYNEQDSEGDGLEAEAAALSDLMSRFNSQRRHWIKIVEMLGQLDVLISFAAVVSGSSGSTCRPRFVSIENCKEGRSVLNMKGLWHPYAIGGQGGVIVPNDLELGSCDGLMSQPRALLLTGPNMGGKSTLLRATCLAAIMAQLGCFVPCEACILSPVDTIFTRLGASDRILTGESTFMVECMEAASVFRHATSNSLVILDELGRGTSTFDGYSIAYAALHELVNRVNCRLMFATHYHPLTDEFGPSPLVSLGHMSCGFQDYPSSADSQQQFRGESVLGRQLVFLYKLAKGACPKSYGLQVALLAGLPTAIVKSAENVAEIIQTRVAPKFELKKASANEPEWAVRAVLAAADFGRDKSSMEQSYSHLLSTWRDVRKRAKTCGQ